jgi:hypothetical protein
MRGFLRSIASCTFLLVSHNGFEMLSVDLPFFNSTKE